MTSRHAGESRQATGGDAPTRIERRMHGHWLAGVMLAGLLAVALPVPSAAAVSFKFDVQIGACFFVQGPASSMTDVSWRSANGHLKGHLQQLSDLSGVIPGRAVCTSNQVAVGDRITASTGGLSRTFKVPTLTATFDRVGYHVSGQGPAGSTLGILAHGGIGGWNFKCRFTVSVPAGGHYSINIQGLDGGLACPADYTPAGGDTAAVTWTGAHLDTVARDARAQLAVVNLGKASISGAGTPGRVVHFTLRSSAGALRGKAQAVIDAQGAFDLIVRDTSGHSVIIAAGDRVSGDWAGHQSVVVPEMHFTPISVYHWLYGWCMPNARYLMLVRYGSAAAGGSGTTDSSGETQVLVAPGHVNAGETMVLTCAFGSGDQVVFSQRVP